MFTCIKTCKNKKKPSGTRVAFENICVKLASKTFGNANRRENDRTEKPILTCFMSTVRRIFTSYNDRFSYGKIKEYNKYGKALQTAVHRVYCVVLTIIHFTPLGEEALKIDRVSKNFRGREFLLLNDRGRHASEHRIFPTVWKGKCTSRYGTDKCRRTNDYVYAGFWQKSPEPFLRS